MSVKITMFKIETTDKDYQKNPYRAVNFKRDGSGKPVCCPKASSNRTIRMNQELTAIHQEVISNLESVHGALLRMNRSIQAEGTIGVLKWDKSYKKIITQRREKSNS